MKATVEIPDELYRQVKAKSALEGRPVREVAVELFRGYVAGERDTGSRSAVRASRSPLLVDGKPAPAWFGLARKHVRRGTDHDLDAVRKSIERGWAQEVAKGEAALKTKRR